MRQLGVMMRAVQADRTLGLVLVAFLCLGAGCSGSSLPDDRRTGLSSPGGSGPGGGPFTGSPAGSLTVSVTMQAGSTDYRTQARVADIDRVTITVEATATSSVSATIASVLLSSGSTSQVFGGLPPGPATVSASVFDASNVLIGNGSATASVQSGQATIVSLPIQLVPTIVRTGSLGANIVISDGAVIFASPTPTPPPAGFVALEPGTFTMGSPTDELVHYSNETQHQVTLTRGFYLQATEVTQGQWKALIGNNPSTYKTGDDYPVETVNWWEAASYANELSASQSLAACYTLTGCSGAAGTGRICGGVTVNATGGNPYLCTGYRLPTEAEWEYAYRAGTTTAFYSGDITQTATGDPKLDLIGWYGAYYGDSSAFGTHPVAVKIPNAWGLHDMAGNVWEWAWDWYGAYPGATTDPLGLATGSARVYRGGSWRLDAQYARSAYRLNGSPDYRSTYGLGFRLARSRL